MSAHYILDEDRNITKADLFTWSKWIENTGNKVVEQTDLDNGYWVSTVFLGLDHGYGDGPPILFETMVTNPEGDWENYQERHCTWQEAEIGHAKAVALYFDKEPDE